jgi:hypothetical protein
MRIASMTSPVRRLAARVVLVTAVVIVAGTALVFGPATTATANTETCSLYVYPPTRSTWDSQNFIDFRTAAYCRTGTQGRLYMTAERHRWWGWEQLTSGSAVLNSDGDRQIWWSIHCPGSLITEGTWTFRTRGLLRISHWWGWDGISGISAERRYGCYD